MATRPAPIQFVRSEHLLVYGRTACPRCLAPHAEASWLKETWQTRFALLRFTTEMMADKSRSKARSWTDMKTKEEKLRALRSMRNRMPMFDTAMSKLGGSSIRQEILRTMAFYEEMGYRGLTLQDLHAALDPTEFTSSGAQKGALPIDKFRSVLAELEKAGNVRSEGAGSEKKYWIGGIGGPPRKIDPTLDDRATHMLGAIHEMAIELPGEFMIGLLKTPTKTFVAASGTGLTSQAFKNTRKAVFPAWVECVARTAAKGPHLSRTGRVIQTAEYSGCQGHAASPPGNCAAPRLLEMAFADPAVDRGTFRQWAMSEIWYLPSPAKMASSDLAWTHGISAESCATCANLVPLLCCPVP